MPLSLHRARRAAFCALVLSACRLETEGTGEPWSERDEPIAGDDQSGAPEDAAGDDGRVDRGEQDAGQGAVADASVDRVPDDGGRAEPPGSLDCTKAGAFALRVDFDVTWLGTSWAGVVPVLAEGAGTLTIHALASFPDDGLSAGTLRACGARIPDFEAGQNIFRGELYGTYIPESAWDQSSMPSWPVSLSPACSEPGCGFQTNLLEALLGVRTEQRPGARGMWGRTTALALTPVDDDADGYPGITLRTRSAPELDPQGRPYVRPPLGTLLTRADKLMLGIALRAQIEGTFERCDTLAGSLREGSVETTAVGCTSVSGGGELPCDPGAIQFLDQNLPAWTVHAARFRGVRTQATDCASVRAALP